MGVLSRALTLALTAGLVGCTVPVTQRVVGASAPLAAPEVVPQTPISTPAPVETQGYGRLNLSVRWPEPSGYNVALLPTTTNAIAIWIKKDGLPVIAPTVVSRQPNATTASTSIRVEAASNLSVDIKAYREATPDLATAVPIAQNSGVVNVVKSKATPLSLSLNPLTVPTVTAFDRNLGRVGETITVTGTGFGSDQVPIPTVSFNGTPATSVTRNSETSLTVGVPSGATSGYVVVTADGVKSTSAATFWVFSSLTISAPAKESWDTSPSACRMVRYGQSIAFNEQHYLAWKAQDDETSGRFGTPPLPTWATSNPAAGGLDEAGQYTAATAFATSSITAHLGPFTSNAFEVRAVGVDSVTLDQSELSLNARPSAGEPDLGYVTLATLTATVHTSAPFDHGVTWSSSDTNRATVSNGVVQTARLAPEGTVTITATSVDDPAKKATASVTVTNYGGLVLGIQ